MNNIKFIGSLFACTVTRIGTRAIVAMLLLASPLLGGCATPYYSKPFGGQVVDALSGKPMEGVNVLAAWNLEFADSGKTGGTLMQSEAVTDQDGRFEIAGWGPVEIQQPANGRLRIRTGSPGVMAFKPGYDFGYGDVWSNAFDGSDMGFASLGKPFNGGPSVREAKLDRPIKLKLFPRSEKEYFSLLYYHIVATGDCLWTKAPRMIAALINEQRRGIEKYPGTYWGISEFVGFLDKDPRATKCGSFKQLIEPFLK